MGRRGKSGAAAQPSPIDDPSTSTYLDEEEAELEGLEEAASAVSSELDPSKLPMNISCLSVLKADWERSFNRQ